MQPLEWEDGLFPDMTWPDFPQHLKIATMFVFIFTHYYLAEYFFLSPHHVHLRSWFNFQVRSKGKSSGMQCSSCFLFSQRWIIGRPKTLLAIYSVKFNDFTELHHMRRRPYLRLLGRPYTMLYIKRSDTGRRIQGEIKRIILQAVLLVTFYRVISCTSFL